jgi:hypothetical protein
MRFNPSDFRRLDNRAIQIDASDIQPFHGRMHDNVSMLRLNNRSYVI